MSACPDPCLFVLDRDDALGTGIAGRLGLPISPHEERMFEGGEHKCRPLVEVARRNVFVVQSLYGDADRSINDRLIRLLFFIGALKDAGAAEVTAVTPYLAYNRKDRRTKARDPVNSRYIAALFEAVSTDRILAVEAHNLSAFENAFRTCRPEHVSTAGLFANHFAPLIGGKPAAVVSPDAGGNKRAELFRSELEHLLGRSVGKAIMDKHRSMGEVSGSLFAGSVEDCTAIIVDDLISTGGTIVRATQACRRTGAREVIAIAAHGLFAGDTSSLFGPEGPDAIHVTDSVASPSTLPTEAKAKLHIVSAASLLGDVIGRIHSGEPVSDLLPYD
jgi:ribose-phosphate pyrophosphokinase